MNRLKVTIDRARWAFGADGGELYNGDKFCALGFVGLACGFSPVEMLNGTSLSFEDDTDHNARQPIGLSPVKQRQIHEINDEPNLATAAREAMLENMCYGAGIDLNFKGDYT